MTDFRLPSLGADMDEATVLEWKVGPGDRLVPGDIVLVIDTEKSEMDVEAIHPGTVTELVVPVGATVPVGTVLARYEPVGAPAPTPTPAPAATSTPTPTPSPAPTPGPARSLAPAPAPVPSAGPIPAPAPLVPGPPPAPPEPLAPPQPASPVAARARPEGIPGDLDGRRPEPVVATGTSPGGAGRRVAASPLARRLATEGGVDLAGLTGTGPGGAVIARDVRQAPGPGPAATGRADRASGLRHAIGGLMARSKREIPHYYLDEEIDLAPALDRLRQLNDQRPVAARIVPAALLLRAVALAAAASPDLNGHHLDGRFVPADTVNLGTAVSLRGGGLVAPAILGAERRSLDQLMADLRDLVARARAGRLKPAELSDATITVTNLGDQGVRTVHPVIVPPQVAMVGFGRISARPVVLDGQVVASEGVTASLAADHRVSDGMAGARFLTAVARHLADLDQLFGTGGDAP